jgi:hypothetical protein
LRKQIRIRNRASRQASLLKQSIVRLQARAKLCGLRKYSIE